MKREHAVDDIKKNANYKGELRELQRATPSLQQYEASYSSNQLGG
jgi:hypothetical protein